MTSRSNKKELLTEKLILLFETRALDLILLEKRQIPISKEDIRKSVIKEIEGFSKYYDSIENELKPQSAEAPVFLKLINTASAKLKLLFSYLKNESIDEKTFDQSIVQLEPWYNLSTFLVYFNGKLKNLLLGIKDLGEKTKTPEAAKSPLSQLFDKNISDKIVKDIEKIFGENVTIYDFKFDEDDEDEGIAQMEANFSTVASAAGVTAKASEISGELTKIPVTTLVNIATKPLTIPKDISKKVPSAKEDNIKVIENFLNKLIDKSDLRKKTFERLSKSLKDQFGVDVSFEITDKGGKDIKEAAKKINDLPKSNPKVNLAKMVEIIKEIEKIQ